jgi:hypothetical protein
MFTHTEETGVQMRASSARIRSRAEPLVDAARYGIIGSFILSEHDA